MKRLSYKSIIFALFLFALPGASGAADFELVRHDGYATVTLTLIPAQAGDGLAVRVDTGPLPHGDMIVADDNGEVVGAVSPFGIFARRRPSSAVILLPQKLTEQSEIRLRLWVVDPESRNERRAPKITEIEDIKLVSVPKGG